MPAVRDFYATASFESQNSEVVRSIQQRDLLNRWLSLYAAREAAPVFTDYDPGVSDSDRSKLVYYKILSSGEHADIIIESYGTLISQAYGVTGQGRELSEYLGPDRAPLIVPLYQECIRRQLPVYTISRVEDSEGRQVDLERILLPFGDGQDITHIIGSFETISMEGHFQLRGLISDHRPVDLVRAVIDRDLHFTPPPRISSNDKIEFE